MAGPSSGLDNATEDEYGLCRSCEADILNEPFAGCDWPDAHDFQEEN